MNKKAVAWSVIIGAIIGLFVIGLVVMGPLKGAYSVVSEKIFGIKPPAAEGGFVPYVPQYSEEERQIIDSMNALTCAINSIAAGRFDPTDIRLCPKAEGQKAEMPKEAKPVEENKPPEVAPLSTAKAITGFFYKITGFAAAEEKVAKYGNVTVSCEGKPVEQIYLGSKDVKKINRWQESFPEKFTGDAYAQMQAKDFAVKQVGDAMLDCWDGIRSIEKKDDYHLCAILNTHSLLGKIEKGDEEIYSEIYFGEDDIKLYFNNLIQKDDPRKDTAEILLERNYVGLGKNRFSIAGKISEKMGDTCGADKGDTETDKICGRKTRVPADDTYCVYFDKGKTYILGAVQNRDFITIDECREYVARDTFKCYVKDFELPQKIEWEGWYNPLSWVAGNNDPRYLAYYEAFPEGVDQFWHVDGVSAMTVGLIVGTAAFDIIPLAGKGIKYAAKGVKEGVKETATNMLQKGIMGGLAGLVESITKRGAARTVQKELLKESIENLGGGVGKKLAGQVADEADNLVTSVLGLKRLKGIPAGTEKELVEKLTGAIRKMDLSDITPDTAFAREFQENAVKKAGKKLDDLIDADKILTDIEKETDPTKIFLYEKTLPRPRVEIEQDAALLKQIRKEMQEAYYDKASKEMAESCVKRLTTRVTKQELKEFTERTAVKKFLGSLFDEGVTKLSKEELEKSMSAAMKKFAALPDTQKIKAVEKGMGLSKQFVDTDGFLDFAKIAGKPVDDAMKTQLTGDFIDVIALKEGVTAAGMMTKYGWSAAKGLKTGTVGPGYISWTLDLLGVPRAWRIGKTALESAPLNTIPVAGTAVWAGKVGVTTVGEAAGWIKNHKYPIIALLAFYAASRDAAYEKYQPVGTNTVGVDSPFLYTDPAPWNLVNETRSQFIAVMDSGGSFRNQRLYLVSPCKANLVVSKAGVKCNRMPVGVQHYRFSEENNPMDVKNIDLDTELLADDIFVLENFKKSYPDSAWLEMPENEAITKVVNDLNSSRRQERMTRGVSSLYARYPYLEKLDPDPLEKSITKREQAIVAMHRKNIVEFYDKIINGAFVLAMDNKGILVGIHKEEPKDILPYSAWQAYEPFFDLSNIQKECFDRGTMTDIIGSYKDGINAMFGQDIPIEESAYVHPEFYADTITVQVQSRVPGWNKNANYCIDEYSALENVRYGFFAAQIVTSLVATGIASVATAGAGAPIALPLTLAGSSVVFGFIEEGIARQYKWPAYQNQGVTREVPIAQSMGEGGGLNEIETQYTVAG